MRDRGLVLGIVLALLGVTPALAEDPHWSFSTSVNYSKGDYGTKEDTTIVYVPFTFGVAWERFGLRPDGAAGAGLVLGRLHDVVGVLHHSEEPHRNRLLSVIEAGWRR